jgi:hypothetical protein
MYGRTKKRRGKRIAKGKITKKDRKKKGKKQRHNDPFT